jgi:hypothetical protein
MNELRPIPGFEGRYSVTNDGQVFSHPKTRAPGAVGGLCHDGRWLKPRVNDNGYLRVSLMRTGTKRSSLFFVHALVALAWVPNLAHYPRINHMNGIKTDNRSENLEWCTTSMNTQHAWDTGLLQVSEGLRESARRNIKKAHEKRGTA